jgi:GNAT superfamily N-acetyltransferase
MQSSTASTRAPDSRFSFDEFAPRDFANACWEVHPAVRGELEDYLASVLAEGRGQLIGAFDAGGTLAGRGMVEIHPGYASRGFPCAAFGWLDGTSEGAVNAILEAAAGWAAAQQVVRNGRPRRNAILRGPVSFPKELGGLGCQVEGYNEPRLIGVSTNRPDLDGWIEGAGYTPDAPYACVDVTNTPVWDSAPNEVEDFTLVTLSAAEWRDRIEETAELASHAFGTFLPDSTAGRLEHCIDVTSEVSDPFYSWPASLDADGKLAGFIMALPNLWEKWDGKSVVSLNVDTILIAPQYRHCGLMSALHNKGVTDTAKHMGIRYYEGTAIWLANENAVKTIFPHGRICRKHVVFQKRLNKPI